MSLSQESKQISASEPEYMAFYTIGNLGGVRTSQGTWPISIRLQESFVCTQGALSKEKTIVCIIKADSAVKECVSSLRGVYAQKTFIYFRQ